MTDQAPDNHLSTADLLDRWTDALTSIPVQFRSIGRKSQHRSSGSPTIRVWALAVNSARPSSH